MIKVHTPKNRVRKKVNTMDEYILLNKTPFETFIESFDVDCETDNDDLDVYSEMYTCYKALESMIQEGQFMDTITGAGKNESMIKKILLFIPRLIKAIVQAIGKMINKNKGPMNDIQNISKSADAKDINIPMGEEWESINDDIEAFKSASRYFAQNMNKLIDRSDKFMSDSDKNNEFYAVNAVADIFGINLDATYKAAVDENSKSTINIKRVAQILKEQVADLEEIKRNLEKGNKDFNPNEYENMTDKQKQFCQLLLARIMIKIETAFIKIVSAVDKTILDVHLYLTKRNINSAEYHIPKHAPDISDMNIFSNYIM